MTATRGYAGAVTWGAAGPAPVLILAGYEGADAWVYGNVCAGVSSAKGSASVTALGGAVTTNVNAATDAYFFSAGSALNITVTAGQHAGAVTLGSFDGSVTAGSDAWLLAEGSVNGALSANKDGLVYAYGSVTGGFSAGRDIGVITYGSLNAGVTAGRDVVFARASGSINGVIAAGQNIGGEWWDPYSLGAVSSYGSIGATISAGSNIASVGAVGSINGSINALADIFGGADTLYGDSGEDQLFGGGGADVLLGGGDSDFIEGQNGRDSLFGGGGIDFLKLDTAEFFTEVGDVYDGHFGNRTQGDVIDDNATDIVLIEGTNLPDVITLMEHDVGIASSKDLSPALVANGRPSAAPVFTLNVNGTTIGPITVANTANNNSLTALTVDINAALDAILAPHPDFAPGQIHAVRIGNRIRFETRNLGQETALNFTAINNVMQTELQFGTTGFAVPLLDVEHNVGSAVEAVNAQSRCWHGVHHS